MAPTTSGSKKLRLAAFRRNTRFASSKRLPSLPACSADQGAPASDRPSTPPKRPTNLAQLKSTPMRSKHSSAGAFTSIAEVQYTNRLKTYSEEMTSKILGPIAATKFVDRYLRDAGNLPRNKDCKEALQKLQSVITAGSEAAMYQPLIEALGVFCDGMELVNTSNHADIINAGPEQDKVKPDITMYKVGSGRDRPTDMSLAQTHFEVKFDDSDDPFHDVRDDDMPFVHTSDSAMKTLGQITSYAIAQFSQQYRTHLFTVFIQKEWIRLIRWDRSGAVVSQRFNIGTAPGARLLAQFIWRFSRASDADRGLDDTVSLPGPEDVDEVVCAREALGLQSAGPIWKFAVYNDEKKKEGPIYCYGSKPRFRGRSSLTGRCTRAILVWHPVRKMVVLLKDTWRVFGEDMVKEGEVYQRLHAKNVSNIPKCYESGEVPLPHHHTETDDIQMHKGDSVSLRQHQHYRLLLEFVGEDITTFTTTRELVSIMRDAIRAHAEAFTLAGILHRDISAGNILIGKDGHGYLIDWDLSKPTELLGTAARQPERTGTWQFIAARLLLERPSNSEPIVPSLADDLESFFHVLCWLILRFTKHSIDEKALAERMRRVYDAAWRCSNAPGRVAGGESKRDHIVSKYMTMGAGLPLTELRALLGVLEQVFGVRYAVFEAITEAEMEQWRTEYRAARSEKERQSLEKQYTGMYVMRLDSLNSDWMIARFTQALDSDNWPEEDTQRVEHVIETSSGSTKVDMSESGKRRSTHDADGGPQQKRVKV